MAVGPQVVPTTADATTRNLRDAVTAVEQNLDVTLQKTGVDYGTPFTTTYTITSAWTSAHMDELVARYQREGWTASHAIVGSTSTLTIARVNHAYNGPPTTP